MNKPKWTDQDVQSILDSVEETIAKAEALAKADSADPDPKDDKNAPPDQSAAPASSDAPPSGDAPPADDGSGAPPPDAGQPPADGAQPPPGDGSEQQLQAEGQPGEDQPLSDEELAQIYGSMPPDELERHYSIIRQQLQAAYSQDQGAAPAAPESAAPPAPAAPAPQGPPQEMGKSENAVIAALEKRVAQAEEANQMVVKAFEALAKPARKSITEIQVMNKTELDNGSPQTGPMTVEQVKERARKLSPAKLEKSERDMINRLFISGEGAEEVERIIHSKGGK